MGHENDEGFQMGEKSSFGLSNSKAYGENSGKSNDGSVIETVVSIPENLPGINCSIGKSSIENLYSSCNTSSIDAENWLSSGENGGAESLAEMGSMKMIEEQQKAKVFEGSKDEKQSWVIDVKCGDGKNWEGERICRICHLSSDQARKTSMEAKTDLIRLGCGCKGELSVAHSCCAEAWFKLKGNRMCEICGEAVNNVKGIGNERFMEEWNESSMNGNTPNSFERSEEGCCHRQPFCNFLMACLVIAFVLPWFLRINLF